MCVYVCANSNQCEINRYSVTIVLIMCMLNNAHIVYGLDMYGCLVTFLFGFFASWQFWYVRAGVVTFYGKRVGGTPRQTAKCLGESWDLCRWGKLVHVIILPAWIEVPVYEHSSREKVSCISMRKNCVDVSQNLFFLVSGNPTELRTVGPICLLTCMLYCFLLTPGWLLSTYLWRAARFL